MTLRLAHRGDHRNAPENSLAALLAAARTPGCDGVEFDVRFAGDGQPIVLHDETLDRVQGRPERAADHSAADLAQVGVPTLGAVLAALPGAFFLDIELKEGPMESLAAVLLAGRGEQPAAAAISSFDPADLTGLSPSLAGWPRWLNAKDLSLASIEVALAAGCEAMAVHWSAIDGPALRRAEAAGLSVSGWTVRRRPTRDRLERLGIGSIGVEGRALEP